MSPELVGRGTPRSLVLSQQWEENQPFQLEAQPPVTEAKQAAALGSLYPLRPPTHPYPPHSCPTGSAGLDRGLKEQTGGEIIFPGMQVSTTPPQKKLPVLYTAGPHPPRYPRGLDRSNSSISVLARGCLAKGSPQRGGWGIGLSQDSQVPLLLTPLVPNCNHVWPEKGLCYASG